MSFLSKWKNARMESRAREVFGVERDASYELDRLLGRCAAIYQGRPHWINPEAGVETVNFAKAICAETARLAMLGVSIHVDGSRRAEWLQEQIDSIYFRLRSWVEYGCAWGTVILKPNGEDIELVTPEQFLITDQRGGTVTGCVFQSGRLDDTSGRYYTRLEYHRFLPDGRYAVSNRCFAGDGPYDMGKAVHIDATPWAGLAEDVALEGLQRPLFAVLRTPGANNIQSDAAMGLPVFADALAELRDFDIAYSRFAGEIADSRRLTLIDDRLIEQAGRPLNRGSKTELPRYARKVFGAGPQEYFQDIDPALHTAERLAGMNALLSQIGFKCGFSNGYFVFNERSGLVTATQVEADDRRTIQLVKDVRDQLESALDGLLYALDAFAELYELAPAGAYQAVYDFGDITYNREEDRARWWGYVTAGKVPFWYFLTKFEGFSEQEAKRLANNGQSPSQLR